MSLSPTETRHGHGQTVAVAFSTPTRRDQSHVFRSILEPDRGLIERWALGRNPQGLWKLAIELPSRPFIDGEFSLNLVGAVGVDKKNTIERGVGEAVERFAVLPVQWDDKARTMAAKAAGVVPLWDHALAATAARDLIVPMMPTTELRRRSRVQGNKVIAGSDRWIPQAAVDYPAPHACFDATPSGAASGLDLEFALLSAFGEILERDAMLHAWANPSAARRIPDSVVRSCPEASSLFSNAEKSGLRLDFVWLQTPSPDLLCIAALACDEAGRFAAVGMKSSPLLGPAVLGAGQEAMQVAECYDYMLETYQPKPMQWNDVVDDLSRAQYWIQPEPIAYAQHWFREASEATPIESCDPLDLNSLLSAIHECGGRPLFVDLTHRLPAGVQEQGWRAVKAFILGLQTLLMDETALHSVHAERLGTDSTPAFVHPHPLI